MITSTLQWHSIKETKPAKKGEYLVASIRDGYDKNVSVCYFDGLEWPYEYISNEKDGYKRVAKMQVQFWSPLPEYPREV